MQLLLARSGLTCWYFSLRGKGMYFAGHSHPSNCTVEQVINCAQRPLDNEATLLK